MSEPIKSGPAVSFESDFKYQEAPAINRAAGVISPVLPVLSLPPDPMSTFQGKWTGSGFNTIFRPNNTQTPTPLPIPAGGDNILQLNLTAETLTFSDSLGSVPNRGTTPQGDITLNGVPYVQAINDVTTPSQPFGIHLEPGLWVTIPTTSVPVEGPTLARMASIPHGTTVLAQGTSQPIVGAPVIPAVNITPFLMGSNPPSFIAFPSQTVANQGTPRIPQNLVALGTITQAMLDDPNSVLRNVLSQQKILNATQISISTNPSTPLFGGGVENIAFLLGSAAAAGAPNIPNSQNAQTLQMTATFWLERVEHVVTVPPFKPGQPPLLLKPDAKVTGAPRPTFIVNPPIEIPIGRPIVVTSLQIQYSQTVILNFNGLSWPHVSVATLVPADPITIPVSVLE